MKLKLSHKPAFKKEKKAPYKNSAEPKAIRKSSTTTWEMPPLDALKVNYVD